jgi:hypothetical protein
MSAEFGAPLTPCRIRLAKFTQVVAPGERVAVEFSGEPAQGVRFRCMVRGATVLTGEVQCIASTPA